MNIFKKLLGSKNENNPQTVTKTESDNIKKLNETLMKAINDGKISEIDTLIRLGADIEFIVNEKNYTPLMSSLDKNQVEIAKILIENGANVNAKDNTGITPLMQASVKEFIDIVKLLLEKGADKSAKEMNGRSAIELIEQLCKYSGVSFPTGNLAEIIDLLKGKTINLKKGSETDVNTSSLVFDSSNINTVKIGNNIWMAENLNLPIENSWTRPDDTDGVKFGRFYTWHSAMKVCPQGWHVPTNKEWNELIEVLGGKDVAGSKLKEGGSSGFNIKLCGNRTSSGFEFIGRLSNLWTSTDDEEDNKLAKCWSFNDLGSSANNTSAYKEAGYTLRCIKDR